MYSSIWSPRSRKPIFRYLLAVLSGKLRQHVGYLAVCIVVALEREQVHHQRTPLPLGDSDGEQEHYLEVGDASGNDAEARKEGVHQRSRHARLLDFTVVPQAGREEAHLDRVEHAPVRRHVVKTVPLVGRMHHPRVLLGAKHVGRGILKVDLAAGLRILDLLGIPGLEEPIALLLKRPADAPNSLSEVDRLLDCFLSEGIAGPPVHHCRGYVV